jgi:hypothetical protein
MALTKTLKDVLDGASPGSLPEVARALKLGSFLRAMPTFLRHKTPAADPSQLSTILSLNRPHDARAASIFRAKARAGTSATATELAVQAYGATPTTGQIAVAPNGDIALLGTDAWTDVDVEYQPTYGDVVALTLPVVTNAMAIPAALTARGVIYLLDATSNVGTLTGAMKILVPSASTAATGQARLDLAAANVKFASADAVTNATVHLLVAAAVDIDALLESTDSNVL